MTKSSIRKLFFPLRMDPKYLYDIWEPSLRIAYAIEESNNEALAIDLDLLEGRREMVLIRMATQTQSIEKYCNKKANLRHFKVGE